MEVSGIISAVPKESPIAQDMSYEDRPSKTQRKQAMHELQDLGAQLVDLSQERLDEIALPPDLRQAVLEAKRVTAREARRRQLQYIGRLMRDVDPEPIRAKFDAWNGQSKSEKALHHTAERWRDALLAGGSALTEFAALFPGSDLQPLRNLLRVASGDLAQGKAPRHNREIFRIVRAMIESAAGGNAATSAGVNLPHARDAQSK